MVAADTDLLAPGRGQYDRLLPAAERRQQQRERLLRATALAFSQAGENAVRIIVNLAGVSRNTFYEHFSNLEQAQIAAAEFASSQLERLVLARVAAERTPVARWRALIRECIEWLAANEDWASVVRFKPPAKPSAVALSRLGQSLRTAMLACLQATSEDMRRENSVSATRLTAAVVALEELTRLHPLSQLTREVEDEIVAICVRLFH